MKKVVGIKKGWKNQPESEDDDGDGVHAVSRVKMMEYPFKASFTLLTKFIAWMEHGNSRVGSFVPLGRVMVTLYMVLFAWKFCYGLDAVKKIKKWVEKH